ncbi:MAG TPA: hypothetical protein VNL16_05125 [Chloroflexota bacterium]|nr:hypothetical protein [Chloroflexota bacterium]
MTTINDLLREHVTLDIECLDRLYLDGSVPTLQVPGQLVTFLTQHRGNTIPSPVLLQRMTVDFVRAVRAFATEHQIPLILFEHGVRQDDVAAAYREAFSASDGVVFIGVAQEKAQAFKASKRTDGKKVGFDYSRQAVFVNYYYFYLQDTDFGPAFLKVCSYAPFGIKIDLNGHEWAQRQLAQAGVAFDALDNGFLSWTDPAQVQAVCDRLGGVRDSGVLRQVAEPPPAAPHDCRSPGGLRLPPRDLADGGQPDPGVR